MSFSSSFYSKILLFGEYSLITDSAGLVVPYELFEGQLVLRHITDSSKGINQSNRELKAFCEYIKLRTDNGELSSDFDVMSMEFDVAQGLYFRSNIPQGFGIGSSGALTASLYDRYVYEKIPQDRPPGNDEIVRLKKELGELESHFHGSSSGTDPLSSLLHRPLVIRSKSEITPTELPDYRQGKGAVFLLNTARPRKTEPLVNLFLEKCKNEAFAKSCREELTVYNDLCIEAFLKADTESLMENVEKISAFQFEHFSPMIPTVFRNAWAHGLNSEDYKLKLCGAGGGGFILGFSRDFEAVRNSLRSYPLRVVYRF